MQTLAAAVRDGTFFHGLVWTRQEAFSLLENWYTAKVATCGHSLARARCVAGLKADYGDHDWWDIVNQEVDEEVSILECRRWQQAHA